MKTLLALLTLFVIASLEMQAQSSSFPVGLALTAEEPVAAPAANLLKLHLSSKERLQMPERAEIARVCREQGLPAANQNYLKLGQVLGMDGWLVRFGNHRANRCLSSGG
jgi:hypothetical protein